MEWQRHLHFMHALRANMLRAEMALTRLGYRFIETAVQEPSPDRANIIASIEAHGVRFPDALRAFYEVLGAIEFQGAVPAEWRGCEYPDPVSIVPLDPQFWRGELEAWKENEDGEFSPQFSGDEIHKAGFSGGGYHFVFDGSNDPGLFAPGLPSRFTEYLALCNEWGGFPGLRSCSGHTWPIAEIRRDFVPLP